MTTYPPLHEGDRRRQRGFTLIELLVVVAIIAVLVALSVSAIAQTLAAWRDQITATTIRKVVTELDKHVKAVIDQANREPITDKPKVMQKANNDQRVARSLYILARLRQEFPTKFDHVDPVLYYNPPPYPPPPPPPPPRYELMLLPKPTYTKAVSDASKLTSSALLFLALQQGRGGIRWDPDSTLGSSAIVDTTDDGLKEIVDANGEPLVFVLMYKGQPFPDNYWDISSPAPQYDPVDILNNFGILVYSIGRNGIDEGGSGDDLRGDWLRQQGARGDQ